MSGNWGWYVFRSGQDADGTGDKDGIHLQHPPVDSDAGGERRDAVIDAQVNLPARLGMSPFDPDFLEIHVENCSQPNVTGQMHEIIDKELSQKHPAPQGAPSFEDICRIARGLDPIIGDPTADSQI